jgi:hypothetical protein
LDDLFEPGEIHPKEYRSKRKRMMEKTKEITMRLRVGPHRIKSNYFGHGAYIGIRARGAVGLRGQKG